MRVEPGSEGYWRFQILGNTTDAAHNDKHHRKSAKQEFQF
ncbi:hypothetical protein FHS30_000875 [Simiduia aestuariiviva]|uniref:Uncharacterized protein n=1 Tax=Simiduia aestuariiviva TaxID=1510459 RepID=A0A839UMC7_9GAMM|nr:hypothetical protein [Simiduia aestuariiviva]